MAARELPLIPPREDVGPGAPTSAGSSGRAPAEPGLEGASGWSAGEVGLRNGVVFATVGCRLNQAETEESLAGLAERGYRLASDGDARLAVVNTCAVTAESTATSRKLVRRVVRDNPGATVVVTGCYATAEPELVAGMPGVDLVIPNDQKVRLPELVFTQRPELAPTPAEALVGASPEDPRKRLHTRVSIRVQTGCDVHCAFCIIPSTRGALRSRSADEIVGEVRRRVADGVREVVLTGVHLGRYGHDLGEREGLARLVVRLLSQVDGLERLRLSSVLPLEVTRFLVDVMADDPRICRHLHIPLQSGSDRILQAMGRGYDVTTFFERLEHARDRLPHLGLSTDIIVGFPGETRQDFEATRAAVERAGFAKLHVFRYSPRPGTRAASVDDDVPDREKRERSAELIRLGQVLRDRFHAALVGSRLRVVVEYDRGQGWLQGTADNYVKVIFRGPVELVERVVPVRLRGLRGTAMAGELLTSGGHAVAQRR